MAQLTLLQYVQNILSAMNSDQVNSISDTPESLQVAECVRTTYMNMLGRYDMPEHNQLINLTPSNDNTMPVVMYRPEGVSRIEWIKYYDTNPLDSNQVSQFGAYSHDVNTDITTNSTSSGNETPGYKDVQMLSVEDFMRMTDSFSTVDTDVETFVLKVIKADTLEPMVFTFKYKNDKQPQFCCIISNYYVIFDSFDNTQDSTLQASKTKVMAWVVPQFVMSDAFIPNLQDQQVPLLLNDAKSLAFFEIKNQPHQKAEEEVGRQLVSLQKWKAIANKPSYFEELPNFGRRRNMFP